MLPYQQQLINIKGALIKEFENLRKNKNRPRSEQNINEKKFKIHELTVEYKSTLQKLEFKLKINEWNIELEKYQEIKILYTKSNEILDKTKILPKLKTIAKAAIICKRLSVFNTTMPTVDIKLGTALINTYDGCPEKLNTFLDAVSLFKDTVDTDFAAASAEQRAAASETLFKFIKTRLTGTARQAINGANSVNDVLQKIKEQCSSKVSSDSLRAKLKAVKQSGTITEFCEEIEKLTLQLANLYTEETIPATKANQMATKVGVETLICGIRNAETKTILKAGNFNKISEATQKLLEYNTEDKAQASVFYTRNNQPQRGRGQGRFNGGRGYYQSARPTNRWQGNQQGFANRQPQFRNQQQGYRQPNRFPNQRGQGNRGSWYGTPRFQYQHPQQRMPQQIYYTQTNPPSLPQLQQQIQNQQPQQLQNQQQLQTHQQQQQIHPNIQNQPNFLGEQYGQRIQ